MGITASLIPFPDHNQSPRNTYEAGMAKQDFGCVCSQFPLTIRYSGPFAPLSSETLGKNRAMDIIGFDKRPAGQNFMVAVMSYHGFNIEDALIMNKASIERGLARSTFYRTYEGEERKYPVVN